MNAAAYNRYLDSLPDAADIAADAIDREDVFGPRALRLGPVYGPVYRTGLAGRANHDPAGDLLALFGMG